MSLLLKEGNIVVDGVLASCYASGDHDFEHIMTAPVQWFPKIIEWIFGNDGERPSYINMADDLGII